MKANEKKAEKNTQKKEATQKSSKKKNRKLKTLNKLYGAVGGHSILLLCILTVDRI